MPDARISTTIDILIKSLLILLIIITPLLYGSVEMLHYTIMESAIFFIIFLWFLKIAIDGKVSFIRTPFFLPALFFLLLVFLQIVSLPKGIIGFFSSHSLDFYKHFSTSAMLDRSALALSIYPDSTILEFFKTLSYIAIFFLILNNIKSKKEFLGIFNIIILVGLGISIFGIIQNYTYAHLNKVYWFDPSGTAASPFGSFVNRNHFAGYIEMIIPLAIGYLITDIDFSKKVFYGLAVCIMSLALFLSFSRAGIIVYIASLSFMGLCLIIRRPLHKRAIAILILFIVVLFASMLLLDVKSICKRFVTIFQDHDTGFPVLGRGYLWRDNLKIWVDFPVFGTGLGTFGSISAKYKTLPGEVKFTYAHNDYLQLLSETGVVGFGLVFMFFCLYFNSLLRMWFKRKDIQAVGLVLGCTAAIWAILIHSLVDFNLHIPSNALLFFIIMGLAYRLAFTSLKEDNAVSE